MGTCFSSSKVTGSSSGNHNTPAINVNHNRKEVPKPQPKTTAVAEHKPQPSTDQRQREKVPKESQKNPQRKNPQQQRTNNETNSRRAHVSCGKRTDFGYDKDFNRRYSLGKLLGHGQFGYTFVGIDIANGDRVAVKRLEKMKVLTLCISELGR